MPSAPSPPADLAGLGERILAELGDPRTNSTLTRWLSHHTARLIQAADEAREANAPDADEHAERAAAAIAELWEARTAWPQGWPPPGVAETAKLLNDLPQLDGEVRYHQSVLRQLHELHHQLLAALVDLATPSGSAEVAQGWLETFGDQLDPDEVLLLERVAAQPRRLDALVRWWDSMGTDAVEEGLEGEGGERKAEHNHPATELANTYRRTVLDLIDRSQMTGVVGERNEHDQESAATDL